MPLVVPSTRDEVLIVANYDPTGLEWVDLFDNHLLAWIIDETETTEPKPSAIGSLPPAAPDTSPILSPQWAVGVLATVYVPDVWRGSFSEFLTWLATNNDAERQVGGKGLRLPELQNQYRTWSNANPRLVWAGP